MIDISLVADRAPINVLQVTLNDQNLLSPEDYRRLSATLKDREAAAEYPIFLRQSSLYLISEILLPKRVEGITVYAKAEQVRIVAWDEHNTWEILAPAGQLDLGTLRRLEAHRPGALALPLRGAKLEYLDQGDGKTTLLMSEDGAEIGRFFVRPWYDQGSTSGSFYARLSEQQDRILLYGRLSSREAYPQIG